MGLTMAEAFVLISFILLLLLGAWQLQNAQEREKFAELVDLPEETLKQIAEVHSNPEHWRLIDKGELLRTYDKLAAMPDDAQRNLADMIAIEDPENLVRILKATKRASEAGSPEARLAGIGARLDAAQAKQRQLVVDLKSTIGDVVTQVGGRVEDDGSIVFPDTVLFEVGKSAITSRMTVLLDQICQPWLSVLMDSDADVSGAKIEGHASSEWNIKSSPDEAFRANLTLSQNRAEVVLNECLNRVNEPLLRSWAYSHLISVGYSSARPVLTNAGREDLAASRRVVFSVDIDNRGLLGHVEDEIRK